MQSLQTRRTAEVAQFGSLESKSSHLWKFRVHSSSSENALSAEHYLSANSSAAQAAVEAGKAECQSTAWLKHMPQSKCGRVFRLGLEPSTEIRSRVWIEGAAIRGTKARIAAASQRETL